MVSAVITTYRREPGILKRALDSVFGQDYPLLEVIVVNDAPDFVRRPQIDALVASYGRGIRYFINESNRGANASRNRGIEQSRGEYIAFLDDDDEWFPEKVTQSMAHFSADVGLVYSDMIMVDGARTRYIAKKEFSRDQIGRQLLSQNFVGGFSGVMVRRNVFDQSGGLDESFASFQDMDLWVRMAEYCDFCHIRKALLRYYVQKDSISLNVAKKTAGTYAFLEKHRQAYAAEPKMRSLRIDYEISNYLKNGWKEQALTMYKAEYGNDFKAYLRHYYCIVRGSFKHMAYELIKRYEK